MVGSHPKPVAMLPRYCKGSIKAYGTVLLVAIISQVIFLVFSPSHLKLWPAEVGNGRAPICNFSYSRTVVCEMVGDVRVRGSSGNIHFVTTRKTKDSWCIKPYARKEPSVISPGPMETVRELTITELQTSQLQCEVHHDVPAVVFSTAGYTGNFFHDIADVIVPLFHTAHQFSGKAQFLVTNFNSSWIDRHKPVLHRLSVRDIIDLDADDRVHCFHQAVVGLKRADSGEISMDPSQSPLGLTLKDFARFMRSSYSLPRSSITDSSGLERPRLLIIEREKTRKLLNGEEIAQAARQVGFDVVAEEANGSESFARLVNSCDVMVGVHGAGLTNMVFLPEGAVVVQVVPGEGIISTWARRCYGEPEGEMGMRYLEYVVAAEESTLLERYPRDDVVFSDPDQVWEKSGWAGWYNLFFQQQDYKINITRFQGVLSRTRELLLGQEQ